MNVARENAILPKEWKVITHFAPHFDEMLGLWLLWYWGEERYPGISRAECFQRGDQPEKRTGEEVLESLRVIALGWGFGRFDEHPDPNRGIPRKEGECCATLVAKDLGVRDDPSLQALLAYTLGDDQKGGSDKHHMPYVIQVLHRQGIPFERVVQWTMAGITAKHRDAKASGASGDDFSIETIAKLIACQNPGNPEKAADWLALGVNALAEQKRRFEEETAKEYTAVIANGQFREFVRIAKKGRRKDEPIPLQVVYAESDDPQLGTHIRFKGAAVAIIRNSAQQVQILLNKDCMRLGLQFNSFVKKLRIEEQRTAGRVKERRPEVLSLEGTLSSDGRWHWFRDAQVILNGGFTAPHVPPTRLSIEQIAEWIRDEFDRSYEVTAED